MMKKQKENDVKMKVKKVVEEEEELDFKPGDIIQDYCDPLVKILYDQHKGRRCDHCFKENSNLLHCSGCRIMHYCKKSCQVADWKEAHKFECKSEFFKKPPNNPLQPGDFKRQMFRLFAHLKLNPSKAQTPHKMYNGTTRCLDDLMSHQSKLKQVLGIIVFCSEMSKTLEKEGVTDITNYEGVDYLIRLAGIWKTNAFPITNEQETKTIGSGIYIEPSVFDHSCRPTAFPNMKGYRMQIRAIGKIPKGEPPYVTYLVGHRTRNERAELLMERYNFVCHCPTCKEEDQKGDLVDYKKLNGYIEKAQKTINWKDYIQLHDEIATLMGKVYGEFDQRITNRYFLTLQEAIGMNAPKYHVQKLWKRTEEHLRITFGTENPDYGRLLQLSKFK